MKKENIKYIGQVHYTAGIVDGKVIIKKYVFNGDVLVDENGAKEHYSYYSPYHNNKTENEALYELQTLIAGDIIDLEKNLMLKKAELDLIKNTKILLNN